MAGTDTRHVDTYTWTQITCDRVGHIHEIYLIRHRLRSDSEKKIIRYLLTNYYRREHTCRFKEKKFTEDLLLLELLHCLLYKFYCINSVKREARLRARVVFLFLLDPRVLPVEESTRTFEKEMLRKVRNAPEESLLRG